VPYGERGVAGRLVWQREDEVDGLMEDEVVAVAVVRATESGLAPVGAPEGVGDGVELRLLQLCGLVLGELQGSKKTVQADEVAGAGLRLETVLLWEVVEECGDGTVAVVDRYPVAKKVELTADVERWDSCLDADARAVRETVHTKRVCERLVLDCVEVVEDDG